MPEISLPTGILLSPLKTWVEKKLFLSTYISSHRAYLRRSGFLVRWHELGFGLHASLALPSVIDNDRVPCVRIAVRTSEPGLVVNQMAVLVEAISAEGVYQDTVAVHKVSNTPTIVALPSVPLRSLYFSDSNHIVQAFNMLHVTVLSVDGVPPTATRPAIRVAAGSFDLLNDRFVQRWDAFWNLGAVDRAIGEKAHWFNFHLVSPKVYYASTDQVPLVEIPKAIMRRVLGRPLCWALTRPWLLKAYFWVPIFIGRGKFEESDG